MRIFRKFVVCMALVVCSATFASALEPGVTSDTGVSASSEFVSFCASAREIDMDMNITIREDGSISGEFFMSECGSGPLFGYAQINIDSDDGWWGKLFIYSDILGGCSIPGVFYSVDVPDLLYRWQAGPQRTETVGSFAAEHGATTFVKAVSLETFSSGAGILELLECAK